MIFSVHETLRMVRLGQGIVSVMTRPIYLHYFIACAGNGTPSFENKLTGPTVEKYLFLKS